MKNKNKNNPNEYSTIPKNVLSYHCRHRFEDAIFPELFDYPNFPPFSGDMLLLLSRLPLLPILSHLWNLCNILKKNFPFLISCLLHSSPQTSPHWPQTRQQNTHSYFMEIKNRNVFRLSGDAGLFVFLHNGRANNHSQPHIQFESDFFFFSSPLFTALPQTMEQPSIIILQVSLAS